MAKQLERIIITSVGILIICYSMASVLFMNHLDRGNLRKPFPVVHNVPLQESYQPKVDQIRFSTPDTQDDVMKTPFPQSVENEEWETITHPALVMSQKTNIENHPNHLTKMSVPKFWNPSKFHPHVRKYLGNFGERLITKEEAAMIGSLTPSLKGRDVLVGDAHEIVEKHFENDEEKSYVSVTIEVDEIPPKELEMLETIFVAISSYRDPRCTRTVEQIYKHATHPERIRVAVVEQINEVEDDLCILKDQSYCDENERDIICKYGNQVDTFIMDATLAVGPIFARHIGQRMYRGEYFTMQTDAHMEFIKGWDVDIINQWKSAMNEMAVLTTYVSSVSGHYDASEGVGTSNTRPYMCDTDFETDYYDDHLSFLMHGQQPEHPPLIKGEPLMQPFWAAGFSFARGHFSIQVPYDQYLPMVFQGEEISIGIRAFTYGYDMYAPEKSVLYHYYNHDTDDDEDGSKKKKKEEEEEKKPKKVPLFWENADNYEGVESASKARLLGILDMLDIPKEEEGEEADRDNHTRREKDSEDEKNDKETDRISWMSKDAKLYGTGKVRTVQKFLDTFGIHLWERTVEKHLCDFVKEPMTRLFSNFLRSDGMGIDYDRLTYKFLDPRKHGNTWADYMDTL
jgi:[Skp1-protein]-hydroxyproline N-acetylglucosaminyltransferase